MNERHGERPDTPETEPAPTITSKARTARWYDRRQGNTEPGGGARKMVRPIPDSEPAPTLGAQGLAKGRDVWTSERPSTAVRVTPQEVAILQGFPPDYPFQGSRTKQFEQVGNAVPPPLARAIVEALVQAEEMKRAA